MHVSNPLAETALVKFIEHFCRKVAICVFHCAAKYQGELIYKNLIGCPHCATLEFELEITGLKIRWGK